MKLKHLILLLIAFIICVMPVYAADGGVAVSLDRDLNIINATAQFKETDRYRWVTVTMLDENNKTAYFNQFITDGEGNAKVSFGVTQPSGYYTIRMNCNGMVLESEIEIISLTAVRDVLDKVNTYLARGEYTELLEYLKTGKTEDGVSAAYAIGLDIDELNALTGQTAVLQRLEKNYQDTTTFIKDFRESVCVQSLKESKGNEIACVLDKYKDIINLQTLDSYALYTNPKYMDDGQKSRLYNNLSSKNESYDSLDEFKNLWNDEVVAVSANGLISWGSVEKFLYDAGIFKTPADTITKKYEDLSDDEKYLFAEKFVEKRNYKSKTDVENYVEILIDEVKDKKPSSVGGNTGSDSGSGSGSHRGNSSAPEYLFENVDEEIDISLGDNFKDIEDAVWAKYAINYLADLGIINGYADKTFRPNQFVTREEFVKMIITCVGAADEFEPCNFADVNEGDWFYPYVCIAKDMNLVLGTGDDEFGVGENITRQDAAVILYRYCTVSKGMTFLIDKNDFDDFSNVAEYAQESVSKLAGAEIINGTDENKFLPEDFTTRAEAAKLLYQIIR